MALGQPAWREARTTLQRLLSSGEGALRDNAALRRDAILPMVRVQQVFKVNGCGGTMPRAAITIWQGSWREFPRPRRPFLHPRSFPRNRQAEVELHLPMSVGDYTDFYASKHHAHNCGVMFRDAAQALPRNWWAGVLRRPRAERAAGVLLRPGQAAVRSLRSCHATVVLSTAPTASGRLGGSSASQAASR
jgi:hypothetical protein